MDRISKAKRSTLMARIKSRHTDVEIVLRKALWNKGIRYRINYLLTGKPDIIIPKYKVAIFCDGEFWHGFDYNNEKSKYTQFWIKKIKRNIIRDKEVNKYLKQKGWEVIRLWRKEIMKNPSGVADLIAEKLQNQF